MRENKSVRLRACGTGVVNPRLLLQNVAMPNCPVGLNTMACEALLRQVSVHEANGAE